MYSVGLHYSQEGGKRMSKTAFRSLGLILIAAALLRDPRCRCGCRTVAQHLLNNGLDGLLGVLA